ADSRGAQASRHAQGVAAGGSAEEGGGAGGAGAGAVPADGVHDGDRAAGEVSAETGAMKRLREIARGLLKWSPTFGAVICLTAAGVLFWTHRATSDINDPAEMEQVILRAIPIGTPIDKAQRFMEEEGFKCSRRTGERWGNRVRLDYVSCRRTDPGNL